MKPEKRIAIGLSDASFRGADIPSAGGMMPPSLARWEACRYLVEAAILAASQCGFQPRVPQPDAAFN
ncbi:MAG: hypothetical protein ABSD57_08625 [Verrucomicrobiota bacterium]|jgi:hypothetical protein